MATKIDVLGTTTVTTVASTVVYTVPSSKVARMRIMFGYESAASAPAYKIYIGAGAVNLDLIFNRTPSGNIDLLTGALIADGVVVHTITPSILEGSIFGAGEMGNDLMIPIPYDYFGVASDDVVSGIVTNAANATNFKVVGVEDDA